MESNLQHEDLLIKLRGKLNEEKIKLWEPPYLSVDNNISQSLQELSKKYSNELSIDQERILSALCELQLNSQERAKANEDFKETGLAFFRVKVTIPKEKPRMLKIQRKLNVPGQELINAVATELDVENSRVKLINNGKVIKPTQTLEEQNVKNGTQIMALVMSETPDEVKKEDNMYLEMKATRDDATLLSEYVNDLADDDEYIKLEDQSGKTVELPPAERKSLLVGLAVHERGRAAIKQRDYTLALVLLLEADRLFGECRSSILQSVDNWAVLQLDIAWCYVSLRSVGAAGDVASRLVAAERALQKSYGSDQSRLLELKGTAANERVLLMRLYLLQGIVAFHQNKREESRSLLEKAEMELNVLRVDEAAVMTLMELGWSRGQARVGLRAASGDLDRAHHYLAERKRAREQARERHKMERLQNLLGFCEDGSAVNANLVQALVGMGFDRRRASLALQKSNNHVAEAVHLLQDQPELLGESELSDNETSNTTSGDSLVEPDNKLVADLEAMGYDAEEARTALRLCGNSISGAVDLLVAGCGRVQVEDNSNPSTSAGESSRKKQKKQKRDKRTKDRELALKRLSSAIRADEDDHLDTSLVEEEQFLAEYKSLL